MGLMWFFSKFEGVMKGISIVQFYLSFDQQVQCSSLILVILNLALSELYFSKYDQSNWPL